jgi:hypothetical protein
VTTPHRLLLAALLVAGPLRAADPTAGWAEIRVTDAATGRGVPLVELETVNGLRFVTDNAGRVAFREPGLMGTEVFFTVRSHGYAAKKDAFGYAGVRVTPAVGRVAEVSVTRTMPAERLCRLTGEGRYRDSVLLGHAPPPADSPHPGRVAGQDTVQAAVYRGKVYWLWGDTLGMNHPLGLFRTAGATTPVPPADSDPAGGLAYDYFTDPKTGFARAMMPLPERPDGVVWIESLFAVPDDAGAERLVGHYSRRKGLSAELEQGIALFDDGKGVFVPAKQLPLAEAWRRPAGHPVALDEGGTRWLLFGKPTPHVRVPATLAAVLDPGRYEAFTCAAAGPNGKPVPPAGPADWRWQKALPPLDSRTEAGWVKAGTLKAEDARFCPADAAAPADRVVLHSGSVRWNAHRSRWVLLAGQLGGRASFLGEVWYAEAGHPTGPFARAVRVATHDRQTFYNVCQHPFLDRAGGRVVHFEGTYTNDFSGNPDRTPRYNYNQVLYRLDLDDPAVRPARAD